ncbi:MAG: hypothetical protein VW169_05825 [Rhodospirillaceae bacterium]
MFDFTGEIWFRLLALPIAATLIAALLLKIATRSGSASRLETAAVGVALAWILSLTLGAPQFPPPRDGAGVAYFVIGGLVAGAMIDYVLPMIKAANRLWETGLDLAVWLFLIWWMRNGIDVIGLAAFAAWGLAMVRLRRAEPSPLNAHTMAVAAAAGLAIIAWIGDSVVDRDIATGLAIALLTYLVWQIFLLGATAGFALMWGGYMGIGIIGLRLLETSESLGVALILLGFIFFADTAAEKLPLPQRLAGWVRPPVSIFILSCLPLILAAIATFVAAAHVTY